MGTKAQVAPLFATPLLSGVWPDAQRWNDDLRRSILTQRSLTSGVSHSNIHGWQSSTDMLEWGGEAARSLCQYVLDRCNEFTVDVKEAGERRFAWLPEMWANVNEEGASNQTHCHPGAQWAAVYYVSDGSGADDDSDEIGGELTFLDPRFPMIRMREPDLRYRRPDTTSDHHEVWIRPTTGNLVMFPAWLLHGVRSYRGKGTRISIAINVSSRPRWE